MLIFKKLANAHTPTYLLLGIVCFIVTSNNSFLSAESFDVNESTTASIAHKHDYIGILEKKIHDLIIRGYSAEEIIVMFSDNHGHFRNNQELIIKIYELLNEQNSKNNDLNIIVKNSESKEVRTLQILQVLQITLGIGATLVLCYLLYQLLNKLKLPKVKLPLKLPEILPLIPILLTEAEGTGNHTSHDNQQTEVVETEHQPAESIEALQQHNPIQAVTPGVRLISITGQHWFANHAWINAVAEQIEHAHAIGLEPAEIQIDPAMLEPVENIGVYAQGVARQIEYARSIGLEPANGWGDPIHSIEQVHSIR